MKLSLCVLGIIFVSLFSMCSEDPDIVFPAKENKGTISGFVEPVGVKAIVYLFGANLTDSTITDTSYGNFSFRTIPYGSYRLRVVADSFGIITRFFDLINPSYSLGMLPLEKHPSQIDSVSPIEYSSFTSINSRYLTDSTFDFSITFNSAINLEYNRKFINFVPSIPFKINYSEPFNGLTIVASVPLIHFFKQHELALKFDKGFTSTHNNYLDFDYRITYYADTSLLEDANRKFFFRGTSPQSNFETRNLYGPIMFYFKYPMEHLAVEESFHMDPFISPFFKWFYSNGSEELQIEFKTPLKIGTTYKISFDTSMMNSNNTHPTKTINFSFKTSPLEISSYYPVGLTDTINPSFKYSFNFPVDSINFIKSFSIKPSVDSLQFSFSKDYTFVAISHGPLEENAFYSIIIDSTLTTQTGEKLHKPYYHYFNYNPTYVKVKKVQPYTDPKDYSEHISFDKTINITFDTTMNISSVEENFSISPTVPINFSWTSDSRTLSIKPTQQLKCNTNYIITIDSGFTTRSNIINSKFQLHFKTENLLITSYSPLHEQINVPATFNIKLSFNTDIDSVTLLNHIHFSPPVDSCSYFYQYPYYYIKHSPFIENTNYTMVISDSLSDKYGIVSGTTYKISFQTIK